MIIGGEPEVPAGVEADQLVHDALVVAGEILEILHQACHEGTINLENYIVGRTEIFKLLDVAMGLLVRRELLNGD